MFLRSLGRLTRENITIDYIFVDDNTSESSSRQLAKFRRAGSVVTVIPCGEQSAYACDDASHHWNDALMLKVAQFKNTIIEYAIKNKYDYLFLADSDLVLHPELVEHLRLREVDIVSELFWSTWHKGLPPEPNVWLFDEYDLVPKQPGEQLDEAETTARRDSFLSQLRTPGIYEVGGLGACTLITRSALLRGVSFAPISNLTIHGEDRFFCIRAAVLGLGLHVDTVCPAYHIYRTADLKGVSDYVAACAAAPLLLHPAPGRITLSMVVRNETGRYLERVLKSLSGQIDAAVILDDASTDGTAELCRALLPGIPVHIIQNETSMFGDEVSLRKKQWEETIKTKPDWILNLDADEVIEDRFWSHAGKIINDPRSDVCCFRLYDMWSDTQYRDDKLWNAHSRSWPLLLRYKPDFAYRWRETPQHCGRFPCNIGSLPRGIPEFRVMHLGWSTPGDRAAKYRRYQLLDPEGVYGVKAQYESILDDAPNLALWK